MAAKLARLIYRMLRYSMQFVDQGAEVYEAAHRQREIQHPNQKAASLAFQIIQAAASKAEANGYPPQPPSSLSRLSGKREI
jgi:plasmid maintenance system killer protein